MTIKLSLMSILVFLTLSLIKVGLRGPLKRKERVLRLPMVSVVRKGVRVVTKENIVEQGGTLI